MRRHADGKCQTCSQEDETIQHFLMESPAQSSPRRAIRDKINLLELCSMLSNTARMELMYQWIYQNRWNLTLLSITLWTCCCCFLSFCCLRCCLIHQVMLRTLIKYYYYCLWRYAYGTFKKELHLHLQINFNLKSSLVWFHCQCTVWLNRQWDFVFNQL